jgi:hypothetical protein
MNARRPSSGKPRPKTAGWQPTGKASTAAAADTRAAIERERAAAAAAAAVDDDTSSSSPTSSPPTPPSGVATWRPIGEKSSVLRESQARYVPLNATQFGVIKSPKRQDPVNDEDLGNPVELARARVALHESKRALGLPDPCDFTAATLMGLHARLKEANACARRLGLGTRYRTVSAGPRSIRIEVYYPVEEQGGALQV